MLFSVYANGQEVVEKRISSDAKRIIISLDLIDHIELYNSEDVSEIYVRTEGPPQTSNFQLTEENEHVLLKDEMVLNETEVEQISKVCIEEPDYTSYQIYIPENREVFVSFIEGNFYTTGFKGSLNLKAENGIVKLHGVNNSVNIQLNSGSVFVHGIENTRIDAETNLGIVVNRLSEKQSEQPLKKLQVTTGDPDNSILVRTILANIYLYGSID